MNESVLIKTIVLYDLRMWMKEEKSGVKNIKGDNFLLWDRSIFYDLTHSSSFLV